METNIFTQPLNLEVITAISKHFPRYANIKDLIYEKDHFLRRTHPCGHFTASLSDHDILCSKRLVYPHIENYVVLVDKGKELIAIEGYNDETKLKNYFVFILHCHENMGAIYFEDISQDENLGKPHGFLVLPNKPVNLLFFIPYRENNRENKISASAIDTTSKTIIRYERTGKKESLLKSLTTDIDPKKNNEILIKENSIFNQKLTLDVLTKISKKFLETTLVSNIVFIENENFPSIPYGKFKISLSGYDVLKMSLEEYPFIILGEKGSYFETIEETNMPKDRKEYTGFVIHVDCEYSKKFSLRETSGNNPILMKPLWYNKKDLLIGGVMKHSKNTHRFLFELLKETPTNILLFIPEERVDNHIPLIAGRASKDGSVFIDYSNEKVG
jgi:hypothetical protein